MFSIFVIVVVTLVLLYWGGFRFTTFCTILIAIWAINVQLIKGDNSLLFGVWAFFLALNIMDINSFKTKKNARDIGCSKEKQSNFSLQIKQYRKELKDELDDDFE